MSYNLLYKPLILDEQRISKANILPRNIYRISLYEYSDGVMRSLAGTKSALIFLIGIYEKKLICIKISEIKPDRFFIWLRGMFRKGISPEKFDEIKNLDELIILDARPGRLLFESFTKNKPIYKNKPSPYRTYVLHNVKYIQKVTLRPDIIKSIYY
jgi:hypothetical protein